MRLHDSNESLKKLIINNCCDDNERGFLFKGQYNENTKTVYLIDYCNLDKYSISRSSDRLVLNKQFLYASIKAFQQHNYVYILIHTHPMQNHLNLEFSNVDYAFFKDIHELSIKLNYKLPLIFGIVGIDSYKFTGFCENELINAIKILNT